MNPATKQLQLRLKALSDPIRLRLIALCQIAECSVTELVAVTGLSQPRVSQHLKQLCDVGLLERFRDGHFVFYRTASETAEQRRLFALVPEDEPRFDRDIAALRSQREVEGRDPEQVTGGDRSLYKALVELTVARPLGDLLDIGCGQGRILKLLASRAHRSVGVDVDKNARRLARAELFLAGIPNCSLRQGDMLALPFEDQSFDTIILDDVLRATDEPAAALREAARLLRPAGRILMLSAIGGDDADAVKRSFANWAGSSDLRLAQPRSIPTQNPDWLLAVATSAADKAVAA